MDRLDKFKRIEKEILKEVKSFYPNIQLAFETQEDKLFIYYSLSKDSKLDKNVVKKNIKDLVLSKGIYSKEEVKVSEKSEVFIKGLLKGSIKKYEPSDKKEVGKEVNKDIKDVKSKEKKLNSIKGKTNKKEGYFKKRRNDFIKKWKLVEERKPNKKDRSFKEKVYIRRANKMIIKDRYKKAKKEYNRNHIVKTGLRYIRNVFLFCFIIGFSFGLLSFLYVYPKLMSAKAKSTELEMQIKEGTFSNLRDTEIYDKNDVKIATIKKMNYVEVPIDKMPEDVINGYIAVEDRRFKSHWGVDIKAIGRAFTSLVDSKLHGDGGIKQGGSTITMQVVKNALIQDNSKTFERKMIEFFLAPALEKRYTKAQIMNFYLNTTHYGNNTDGLGTAAKYYLGKDVEDLTLAESAMFVGISNRPASYNPKDNMENAYIKRERVLKQMLDQGFITREEFNQANEEEIKLNIEQRHLEPEKYYTSYAVHDAAIKLMKAQGFDFKYVFDSKEEEDNYKKQYQEIYFAKSQEVRSGGYKLYTNIDMEKQKSLQTILDNNLSKYKELQENGKFAMQGSAVYIDNNTGYVEAIVGGRGENDHLNRGFLGVRQPGSTIKPFVVYGPAYDSGLYYPSKIVVDKEIPNGPKNAGGNYRGNVSMREALKRSINTVAYNTALDIGIRNSIDYLGEMEFSHLTYYDTLNKSLALGGFSYGTTTEEMAKALSTLFNEGEYRDNGTIRRIESQRQGKVFDENKLVKKQVFKPDTAYMLLENLHEVASSGTGASLGVGNKKVAIKTGTTNNQKDTWLVGGDMDKSIAVWVGYDQPKNTGGYGSTLAGPIWKKAMDSFGYSEKDFIRPDTIEEKYIDGKGNPTSKNTGRKDIFSTVLEKEGKKKKEEMLLKNKKETEKAIVDKSMGRILKLKTYKVKSLEGFNFLTNELKEIKEDINKVKLEDFIKDKELVLAELEKIEKDNKNQYIKYESYLEEELKVSKQEEEDIKSSNLVKELDSLDKLEIKTMGDVTSFEDKVERIEGLINSLTSSNTSKYKSKLNSIRAKNQTNINIIKDNKKRQDLNKQELKDNEDIKTRNNQVIKEINNQLSQIESMEEQLKERLEYINKLEEEVKRRESLIEE